MKWLNDFGCRQFKKEYHGNAVTELRIWADENLARIPSEPKSIIALSDPALDDVASAYGELKIRRACEKDARGSKICVTFGPTGAAKVLFALRQNCLTPWDDAIREHFEWDGSVKSYRRFLDTVRTEIVELAEDAHHLGIVESEIPKALGRAQSSLPKIVDEYYWVTITQGFQIPERVELSRWG